MKKRKRISPPFAAYYFKVVGSKIIIVKGFINYKRAHELALIHKQRILREPLKKLEYLGKGDSFEKDFTKLDKTRS